jgi:hypothetical protein
MVQIGPVTTGEELRRAFGCFPSGVTAFCALVDGAHGRLRRLSVA